MRGKEREEKGKKKRDIEKRGKMLFKAVFFFFFLTHNEQFNEL